MILIGAISATSDIGAQYIGGSGAGFNSVAVESLGAKPGDLLLHLGTVSPSLSNGAPFVDLGNRIRYRQLEAGDIGASVSRGGSAAIGVYRGAASAAVVASTLNRPDSGAGGTNNTPGFVRHQKHCGLVAIVDADSPNLSVMVAPTTFTLRRSSGSIAYFDRLNPQNPIYVNGVVVMWRAFAAGSNNSIFIVELRTA